jgi:hypothetical protein
MRRAHGGAGVRMVAKDIAKTLPKRKSVVVEVGSRTDNGVLGASTRKGT